MICAATCGVPSASEATLMMRPSRSRTGRYANTSSRTRWPRGCDGRDAHVRRAVYDISADTLDIPEGWSVGTLGDVARHSKRSVKPEQLHGEVPYIALEHMPRGSITLGDWQSAQGVESNKCEFKRGEILFGKLRPYFHKVGVAPIDGVCSTDIVVVAPITDERFGFVSAHVSSVEFVEYTNAGATGTRMPRTSWVEMSRYPLVLPPRPVSAALNDLIGPMIRRIVAGVHESRTLATVRDALLPKLISGEIRIRSTAAPDYSMRRVKLLSVLSKGSAGILAISRHRNLQSAGPETSN